jgi:hypothetical protein
MSRYVFKVEIAGIGETPYDAWIDAVEQFVEDPGFFEEYDIDEEE